MPEALTSDRFNEWTACETNGHQYVPCDCDECSEIIDPEGRIQECIYCGDEY